MQDVGIEPVVRFRGLATGWGWCQAGLAVSLPYCTTRIAAAFGGADGVAAIRCDNVFGGTDCVAAGSVGKQERVILR